MLGESCGGESCAGGIMYNRNPMWGESSAWLNSLQREPYVGEIMCRGNTVLGEILGWRNPMRSKSCVGEIPCGGILFGGNPLQGESCVWGNPCSRNPLLGESCAGATLFGSIQLEVVPKGVKSVGSVLWGQSCEEALLCLPPNIGNINSGHNKKY